MLRRLLLCACCLAEALFAGRVARPASVGARRASAITCSEAEATRDPSPRSAIAAGEERWLRSLRVPELKSRLSAAGVSTEDMLEKEELISALLAARPPPFYEAALSEDQGCLTVEVANRQGQHLQLMVDTGASRSALSAETLDGATSGNIDCPSLGLVSLECATAALPRGIDGVLGFDALRRYEAVELDLSRMRLRLHTRPYEMAADADRPATAVAIEVQRSSQGDLPFVSLTLQGPGGLIGRGGGTQCVAPAIVGTGSPITMMTPQLSAAAQLPKLAVGAALLGLSGGGRPAALAALRCFRVELGAPPKDTAPQKADGGRGGSEGSGPARPSRVVRNDVTCYAGAMPLMEELGFSGTPVALVGLDLLCPADGAARRLVLDFQTWELWVD